MKTGGLKILAGTFFLSLIFYNLQAQNVVPEKSGLEINSSIFSAMGYEHNPYESPLSYYDYLHNLSYSETDLIKPDLFAEYGYKLSLIKPLKKIFSFELTSEWQNKKFFRESILNTDRFNIGLAPSITLTRWLKAGFGYEFEKRTLNDADILGDPTKYVLSYLQNSGQLFLKTRPFRKNYSNFYYTLNQQIFSSAYSPYAGTDTILNKIDMDNTQHSLDVKILQYLGKRSRLNFKINLYDRKYQYLPSYDSLLTPNYSYMRHYRDINAYLSFNSKINNSIEFRPYVKFERRKDLFNDYYSYKRFDGGLLVSLAFGKFFLDLDGWYKLYNYDELEAPTKVRPYPDLKYKYYDVKAVLSYKILKGIDITL
jgi:hypothetical protein